MKYYIETRELKEAEVLDLLIQRLKINEATTISTIIDDLRIVVNSGTIRHTKHKLKKLMISLELVNEEKREGSCKLSLSKKSLLILEEYGTYSAYAAAKETDERKETDETKETEATSDNDIDYNVPTTSRLKDNADKTPWYRTTFLLAGAYQLVVSLIEGIAKPNNHNPQLGAFVARTIAGY
jgi:hypothetical protein